MRRGMCFDDEIPLPAPKPTPKPTPKPMVQARRPTSVHSRSLGETYVTANGVRVIDATSVSWNHQSVDVTSLGSSEQETLVLRRTLSLTGYVLDSWSPTEEGWPSTVTLHCGGTTRDMQLLSCHIYAPLSGVLTAHMEMAAL